MPAIPKALTHIELSIVKGQVTNWLEMKGRILKAYLFVN